LGYPEEARGIEVLGKIGTSSEMCLKMLASMGNAHAKEGGRDIIHTLKITKMSINVNFRAQKGRGLKLPIKQPLGVVGSTLRFVLFNADIVLST